MVKCIIIENCSQCPYLQHSGGFGYPKHKPICSNSSRTLPYITKTGFENAQGTNVIPEWCKLNNLPEQKES